MTCSCKWIARHQNLGWSVNYWWSVCSASQFKYYPTIYFLVEITFLKIPHLTIKGSKMCPFGSMFIKEEKKLPDDFDLHGYDPNEPDSDDEPLSDLEIELWPLLICELHSCLNCHLFLLKGRTDFRTDIDIIFHSVSCQNLNFSSHDLCAVIMNVDNASL